MLEEVPKRGPILGWILAVLFVVAYPTTGISSPGAAAHGQELAIPEDEGFHPDADFEMWSVLAHLEGESGRRLGVGVMFFSGRILGFDVSGTFHLVADETASRWSADRDLVVPLFGRSSHTEGRLDEAYDRSRLWRDPDTDDIRAVIRTGGTEISLAFDPTLPQADFGEVSVGPDRFQRIYVLPEGRVTGELSLDGGIVEELSGIGVFQHAWGDPPDPSETGSLLSAHLDDGSAVVAFHGEAGDGGEGRVHALSVTRSGEEPVVTEDFAATPGRMLEDRASDAEFPLEWSLRTTEAPPELPVNLTFETTTGGQPVRVLGLPFWVGRCRVTGSVGGSTAMGSGYVLIRGIEEG